MDERFKLEGVLKLKKFNEHREKINLGKVLKRIEENKIEISHLNDSLEEMYGHQSSKLKKGVDGKNLRTYPIMIQAIRGEMEHRKGALLQLKKYCEDCRKNLNAILGEVEVLEKLKHEHKENYHKYRNVKREREIEDIVNMRRKDD